jgi:hypothetical protein
VGDSTAEFLDSRAIDCLVDPNSLPAGDTLHPGNACTDAEAIFVDENVPQYLVLDKGETPGDTMPLLGWVSQGRDIDKSPSDGPRSALVRIADLDAAEPDCATVRNAAFPAIE